MSLFSSLIRRMRGADVPTGVIFPYVGDNAPDGFVLCDNKTIGRTGADYNGEVYQELYFHIWALDGLSTTSGDPFYIPFKGANAQDDWDDDILITIDFVTNEVFIRQKGAGRDMGSFELDQMQGHKHSKGDLNITASGSHSHQVRCYGTPSGTTGANGTSSGAYQSAYNTQGATHTHPNGDFAGSPGSPTIDAEGEPRTGNETHPKNLAMNHIMKY